MCSWITKCQKFSKIRGEKNRSNKQIMREYYKQKNSKNIKINFKVNKIGKLKIKYYVFNIYRFEVH